MERRAGDAEAPRAPGGGSAEGGDEEPPPILGSWPRLYALVILNLAVLVALFYWFTRAFG